MPTRHPRTADPLTADNTTTGTTSTGATVSREGFRTSLTRLRSAQKAGKGAPPYSLFINRPLGRVLAAAAHQLRMTPNQVTYVSAACTFAGLAVLALAPASWWVGLLVMICLVLGYAFDSADGQLARLRGGGSLLGEWLDHMIDSAKVATVHLAVLVTLYRNFDLAVGWLVVPLVFTVVSAVHFFGMILVDLLARARRAEAGVPAPALAPANLPKTLMKLPTDYGVLCLVFVLLGAHPVFLGVYTFLAVATTGYTLLVVRKWRSDVVALDVLPRG
jgi:phosphatidylglycerophosphate synthase